MSCAIITPGSPLIIQSSDWPWRFANSGIATALKIYLEYHLQVAYDSTKADEGFIFIYSHHMRSAPHLNQHQGAASLLAQTLFGVSPGLKAIQLAMFTAAKKEFGGKIVVEEALQGLRKELEERDALPEIARDA